MFRHREYRTLSTQPVLVKFQITHPLLPLTPLPPLSPCLVSILANYSARGSARVASESSIVEHRPYTVYSDILLYLVVYDRWLRLMVAILRCHSWTICVGRKPCVIPSFHNKSQDHPLIYPLTNCTQNAKINGGFWFKKHYITYKYTLDLILNISNSRLVAFLSFEDH
jgi:hypothetical protein